MFGFFKKTYSIKKDAKPEDTLKRLRAIFSDLGINLVESEFFNYNKDKSAPCSLRLTIANTTKGQNGKGKTKLTALCSAYSEMIERISCLALIKLDNDKFRYSPDEIFCTFDELSQEQKKFIKKTFFSLSNKEGISFEDLKTIFLPIMDDYKENKGFYCVPFYDVLSSKIQYLPLNYISWKNHTTGLCAGNTKEEAIVQGLSEIFERYSQREVLCNEYSLPTIPETYYNKYRGINKIVKYLKNAGISVVVKDASIGKNLPVIMTILIDKNEKKVAYSFGSHPDFPIAVERTLTEFLQGYSVLDKKLKTVSALFAYVETKDTQVCSEMGLTVGNITFYDRNHPLILKLLDNNFSFEINNSYISNNLFSANKKLLKKMISISKNLSENLYIRDMSFLGFPAFVIEVPTISETERRGSDSIRTLEAFVKLRRYMQGKYKLPSADDVINAVDYPYQIYYDVKNYILYGIPNIFVLAIAYLEKDERNKCVEFLDIVLEHKKIFAKYLPMVAELRSVLNGDKCVSEIDDESIRKTVEEFLAYPLKTLFDFAKEVRKEYKLDDKSQIETIEVERIKKILISKYIENTPNQENLREFFKEILSQD